LNTNKSSSSSSPLYVGTMPKALNPHVCRNTHTPA
jgi:hypothetical protein